MIQSCDDPQPEQTLLDTLAQKQTTPFVLLTGDGSEIGEYVSKARAKRKSISQKLALCLVDVATRKGKLDRVKSYWNTYHCQNELIGYEGRLYGKYCKNRFCTVCCSIRKATLINQYLPYIETWEDCHFLTLTIKAVPAKELPRYVKGMLILFKKIINKHAKRNKRGRGPKLEGVKSIECNFNPKTRTYNPHFHVLVRTKEIGEIILQDWLNRFSRKHVQPWAQKLIPIRNAEKALAEIIKYGTKIFTEKDLFSKTNRKVSPYVYVSALDNILSAMNGSRIFDRFGFNMPEKYRRVKFSKTEFISEFDYWVFQSKISNWTNPETGEVLSTYNLSSELSGILHNNIDLASE